MRVTDDREHWVDRIAAIEALQRDFMRGVAQ